MRIQDFNMTHGRIIYLDKLPHCHFCSIKIPARIVDAKYDGKTIYEWWANMCQQCFDIFGLGRTGFGYAQELRLQEKK